MANLVFVIVLVLVINWTACARLRRGEGEGVCKCYMLYSVCEYLYCCVWLVILSLRIHACMVDLWKICAYQIHMFFSFLVAPQNRRVWSTCTSVPWVIWYPSPWRRETKISVCNTYVVLFICNSSYHATISATGIWLLYRELRHDVFHGRPRDVFHGD